MEPFVALMRRYCIDYTNSHDMAVCREVMAPEYVSHMGGVAYERDAHYIPGVSALLKDYPGLGLLVHELITNGDRLAMRFSEHTAEPTGELTCWGGIGVYRWNGEQLLENWVEQDYEARVGQAESGVPQALEPPHIDPWTTTRSQPPDPAVERVVVDWLRAGDLRDAPDVTIDDSRNVGLAPSPLDVSSVTIDTVFTAGDRAAFHVTQRGGYRGGLGGAPGSEGKTVELNCSGLVRVEAGAVASVHAVTSRFEVRSQVAA